jgi:hypothetical protein
MLNDTLELNIAAKLYNKCQTDVNNYSNKCSGPIVICITRLENAILQVQARFVEQRRQPRRH